MKLDKEDKVALGVTAVVLVMLFGFWGTIAYIAWHFILKFW